MVYDSESDVVVMFGGGIDADSNYGRGWAQYNDTWAYDYNTNTWVNMTPASSPPGRGSYSVAYDSESDKIIIFGGVHSAESAALDPTGEVLQKETWAYDYNTNTWENVTPTTSPDPRAAADMAYDSESDIIILFGGYTHLDSSGMEDETWAYDYNTQTWTQLYPTGDLLRRAHSMEYDSENDKIILFGGTVSEDPFTYLDETWVFDYNNNSWSMMPYPEVEDTPLYILPVVISISFLAILVVIRRK